MQINKQAQQSFEFHGEKIGVPGLRRLGRLHKVLRRLTWRGQLREGSRTRATG